MCSMWPRCVTRVILFRQKAAGRQFACAIGDLTAPLPHFGFTPDGGPFRANSGLLHRSKQKLRSIVQGRERAGLEAPRVQKNDI